MSAFLGMLANASNAESLRQRSECDRLTQGAPVLLNPFNSLGADQVVVGTRIDEKTLTVQGPGAVVQKCTDWLRAGRRGSRWPPRETAAHVREGCEVLGLFLASLTPWVLPISPWVRFRACSSGLSRREPGSSGEGLGGCWKSQHA